MRFISILLFICFSLIACDSRVDQGKSTHTLSSTFSSLEGKQDFLKRYIKPKSSFKQLDFLITYRDNSQGFVPGPSDWDIRLVAIVALTDIEQWISGLKKMSQTPDSKMASGNFH